MKRTGLVRGAWCLGLGEIMKVAGTWGFVGMFVLALGCMLAVVLGWPGMVR